MMQEKKMHAAVRYLELKGCEVIDMLGDWLVFDEEGCTVFAKVEIGQSFTDSIPRSAEFERVALEYLAENGEQGVLRCDLIQMVPVSDGRAMLKHVTNVLNA